MKDIEKISKLTIQELEAIADDRELAASEAGARDLLGKLQLAEEVRSAGSAARRVRIRWISGIAAAAVLILGVFVSLQDRGPKDTFDDPALAYAQVQEVMRKIGSEVSKGQAAVDESSRLINDKVEETINKITK